VVVKEGLTTGLAPPGTGVPPQLPENQSTVTPAPTEADRFDVCPWQMAEGVAVGLTGVAGEEVTDTVTLAQVDEVQRQELLSHRAKYVVVVPGAARFSGEPVPTKVPPQDAVYQRRTSPDPPFAVSVIVAGALPVQKLEGTALAEAGAAGGLAQGWQESGMWSPLQSAAPPQPGKLLQNPLAPEQLISHSSGMPSQSQSPPTKALGTFELDAPPPGVSKLKAMRKPGTQGLALGSA